MAPLLVTGAAGFIGFHVARKLLAAGRPVVGIDNLSDYYDPALKRARLAELEAMPGFRFLRVDIAERAPVEALFETERFETVIHLAAQAGIRYSLTHPHEYTRSNVEGFLNILEGCRHGDIRHLVYASSSSVYGAVTAMPFSVHQNVDHPLSLYAATKKANELFAHSYAHLYGLPATGLRFFTVYGPWGRPDMALFIFTRKILAGEPLPLFNGGAMKRDFTYVDDVAEGVVRVADLPALGNPGWDGRVPDPASSRAPWRLYNIGNREPVGVMRLVEILEDCLGVKARLELLPPQRSDLTETAADIDDLEAVTGFSPATPIETGVENFVRWYKDFYRV